MESVLTALIITAIIVLAVLCIYLSKLLIETAETMRSIRELTDLAKRELEPALKSINNVLKTADDTVIAANKQFGAVKKVFAALLGVSAAAFASLKGSGGFFSGLASGFSLFKKRR